MRCIVIPNKDSSVSPKRYRTIKVEFESLMYKYGLDCVCIGVSGETKAKYLKK